MPSWKLILQKKKGGVQTSESSENWYYHLGELVYKDVIVLEADTIATEGMVVADKNYSKIHFISPNIYCCGAGTAGDTDISLILISSNLELHSLTTGCLQRVVTANRMLKQMLFKYQGYIGAALVLGVVDTTGPHHYSICPYGSTDKLPYVTMGSGSLAAIAMFEDKFRPDMEEGKAKKLMNEAIAAGIFNDLESGSNLDLCVISKSMLDFIRPCSVPNKKGTRFGWYRCEKGTTAVLTEKVTPLEIEVLDKTVQTMDMNGAAGGWISPLPPPHSIPIRKHTLGYCSIKKEKEKEKKKRCIENT